VRANIGYLAALEELFQVALVEVGIDEEGLILELYTRGENRIYVLVAETLH